MIENESFEARRMTIVAEYESRFDKRCHVSNDNNSVVSKSSSGHRLLVENTLQNESIDNHTSAISESYIRSSNVYNETTENVSINSGENIDSKKLKVNEASNPQTRETNILNHKPNSQNFRDFKHFKHETLQPENLNPTNKNLLSPSNSTKKYNKTTLIKPLKHINPTSKQSTINQQDQTARNSLNKLLQQPYTLSYSDTSQNSFPKRDPMDDLIDSKETSLKIETRSMDMQLAVKQDTKPGTYQQWSQHVLMGMPYFGQSS